MSINKIPKYIDNESRVLFWKASHFLVGAIVLVTMAALNHLSMGVALAFTALYLLKKYDVGQVKGVVKHFLWHSGLFNIPMKGLARFSPADVMRFED